MPVGTVPPDSHAEGGKYSLLVGHLCLSGKGNVCEPHIRNRNQFSGC